MWGHLLNNHKSSRRGKSVMVNLTGKIIAYESGELSNDEIYELFQKLVDSGLAWQLQGSYGRVAQSLIELGIIEPSVSVG